MIETDAAGLIRLRVNGRAVEAAVPGGRRLLDVLRSDLGLSGTKEGCGEGECGACSVLVDGELVASCLVPACQADGHDVLTVEGLAQDGMLDGLQRAFLQTGGVQCGICTPGLLMASKAWLATGRPPTDEAIREAIAGNLCRCTGYSKIVDAVRQAAEARAVEPGEGEGQDLARRALAAPGPAIGVTARSGSAPAVVTPRSLADALERLAADPSLRPLAGGTDVMVELETGTADPGRPLLDLWGLGELRGIAVADGSLVVGALTTYTELRTSELVATAAPALAEAAAEVGAVQIQNRGTIGGNVATASPAGDLLPVLLATDAVLEVASRRDRRLIPAASFWTGYRRTAREADELLVAIRIPLVPGRRTRFRKLGTRRAQAISKVVLALSWRSDGGSPEGTWHDVRVALGSVAPTPVRAPRTEAVLEGAAPSPAVADLVAETVRDEIAPIDDVRSTADYRRLVTGRMLRRMVLDEADALQAARPGTGASAGPSGGRHG